MWIWSVARESEGGGERGRWRERGRKGRGEREKGRVQRSDSISTWNIEMLVKYMYAFMKAHN